MPAEFWPFQAAVWLHAAGVLLALGFRRNRAVMVLVVLLACAAALAGAWGVPAERGGTALRLFAPWLLLAATVMPERRLVARRNLFLLALLGLACWLTVMAPEHVWQGLRQAFPLGLLPWHGDKVAVGLIVLAALACVLRWVLRGEVMELALAIVLAFVAIAALPVMRLSDSADYLAIAGVIALLAVLVVSYRMAFVDGLAGLPNRRALDEALARMSGGYAVAMVDVDHFKSFNDTHGHQVGDRVLKGLAQQLGATRGAGAYRYGGEEFCLLFAGARARDVIETCEDLRQRVEAMRIGVRSTPVRPRAGQAVRKGEAREVRLTVSIGIAERNVAELAIDVLQRADKALYKAKSRGRNRVVSG